MELIFLELPEAASRVRNQGTKPTFETRPLLLPSIMFSLDKQYLPLVVGGGIVQFEFSEALSSLLFENVFY